MILLSKSCLSDVEKRAVMGVLDREYLGMGVEVKQFEHALTNFFGRPAVCVSTGTAALHLALQAADIGVGDEVLVQSLTFVASFQAISATGAKPVACDVDHKTLCLDWKDAEARLTPKTKAIMPVHYAGSVGDLDGIYQFAKKHELRVIEDAAHAFGTEFNQKKIGGFGDISCFSFDGIKNITSGEGGCVVSDDEDVLRKVRDARLLGIVDDTDVRYQGMRSWKFDVIAQGWRFHMSNIMAAIGIEQLKRFPEFMEKRRSIAILYDELLEELRGVNIFDRDYSKVVPHIYVVRLDDDIDRDAVRFKLGELGIQTGVHYQPNDLLTLYNNEKVATHRVRKLHLQLLTLPIHPDLTENDVEFVVNSLSSLLI